jgi:8-oxo-dGTP pyrophosphatase MutT (NUDIX family)
MERPKATTVRQVSAGGVVYRKGASGHEVALIRVGEANRWQLPKGIVEPDEAKEAAALREVREETGVDADLIAPIDTIEYWYFGRRGGKGVRFHKFVHFYLLKHRTSGSPEDDREAIKEVRWFDLEEAETMLAFGNERAVLAAARKVLERRSQAEAHTDPADQHPVNLD